MGWKVSLPAISIYFPSSLPLPHEGEKRTCVCLMKWAGRGEGGGRGRAGRRRNENCGEKGRRGRERKEQPIKAVDCFGREEEENTKSGHGKKDEEEMERLV